MATYQDELLGVLDPLGGKDYVAEFSNLGVVDIYQETLIGGVDYVIGAFGASNGGTLPDPGVVVFDSLSTPIVIQEDGGMAGFNGLDPLFIFQPPGLAVGQTDTFFIGVFDETQSIGSYTLSVEQAGIPFI